MVPGKAAIMSFLRFVLILGLASMVSGFQSPALPSSNLFSRTSLSVNDKNDGKPPKNLLEDLKGMLANLDDVVDDFVYKRMGAGEQWYGKRKYDPSGNFDGEYNGMGRSDHFRIEIARIQKEEMELKRQRRLAEEEEQRKMNK
jgi:hypothetical protein